MIPGCWQGCRSLCGLCSGEYPAEHPSPPPPRRHVCAAQHSVRRSLQHVSPHAGSAAAMTRWPSWGVSERFQDLPFQRLIRDRSGQIFREVGTQRARPVLNPWKSLGPAAPCRKAEMAGGEWELCPGSSRVRIVIR